MIEQKKESGVIAFVVLFIIFLLSILVVYLGARLYDRYFPEIISFFEVVTTPQSTSPSFNSQDNKITATVAPKATASASVDPGDSEAGQSSQPTSSKKPQQVPQQTKQAAPLPRSEPAVISRTYTRTELNQTQVYMPVFTIFIEGKKKLWVLPSNGSVGIYGTFLATESSGMEVSGSADIVLGLTGGLKTGENKVNLLIKAASSQLEALNGGELLLTIPVTISVKE